MSIDKVEINRWTCSTCHATADIPDGKTPEGWRTQYVWAVVVQVDDAVINRIVDTPIHTCHECSSGPMHFVVKRLVELCTGEEPRESPGGVGKCAESDRCIHGNAHFGACYLRPATGST